MTSFETLQKMCKDLEEYGVTYRVEPYSKTLIRLTDGTKSMFGNFKQLLAHLLKVGGWLYNESKKHAAGSIEGESFEENRTIDEGRDLVHSEKSATDENNSK